MISVLIVDDQDLVREGLRMLLDAEPDLCVVGEAGNGRQALAQVRLLDPDVVLMDAITRRLIDDFCRGPAPGAATASVAGPLSERELEVVRLVAQGLSNAEVAARLYLSEATVKSHVARVLAKLGLRDRVQVVVYAYEHGIVRPGGQA